MLWGMYDAYARSPHFRVPYRGVNCILTIHVLELYLPLTSGRNGDAGKDAQRG